MKFLRLLKLFLHEIWVAPIDFVRCFQSLFHYREYLKNGLWLNAGQVSWVKGSSPPDHLLNRKANKLFRFPLILLSNKEKCEEYKTIVSTTDGDILMLNGNGDTVRRVSSSPIYNDEYINIRKKFTHYFDVPKFRIEDGNSVLVESYVQGTYPSDLSKIQQIKIVKELLRRFIELCRNEKEGNSKEIIENNFNNIKYEYLSSDVISNVDFIRRSKCLKQAPLIPGHGDFHFKNILTEDEKVWIIDWEPKSKFYRPFWHDAMNIFKTDLFLQKQFLAGEFDIEFEELCRVAGTPIDLDENRFLLPAAMSLIKCKVNKEGYKDVNYKIINKRFHSWKKALKN